MHPFSIHTVLEQRWRRGKLTWTDGETTERRSQWNVLTICSSRSTALEGHEPELDTRRVRPQAVEESAKSNKRKRAAQDGGRRLDAEKEAQPDSAQEFCRGRLKRVRAGMDLHSEGVQKEVGRLNSSCSSYMSPDCDLRCDVQCSETRLKRKRLETDQESTE